MINTIEHTFLETNGIRLHAVYAGPADGPLVVLLHGFPEFWRGWKNQIAPLAEAGYRVIVPDQRGYNLSDKPEGIEAYRLDELSRDVVGILDKLGRGQCYLVGHDWGAAVAWMTSILFPERVKKLVILNVPHPAVMFRFFLKSPKQILKSWYIGFFQIPWLPERLLRAGGYDRMARALLSSSKKGALTTQDIEAYKKSWSQPGALTGMLNWYRALVRKRFRTPADHRPKMPVLILWGKKDIALSHEMAQLSVELCLNGQLVYFEDATHWVQHDKAGQVNQEILAFLKRKS